MSKRFRPPLQQKNPEDTYCEKHRERLQLFCDDDQTVFCGECFQSQEHKHHMVSGVREAGEKYRKLFQEILNTLKGKIEVAKSILADEQERMVMIQGEEQNFKEIIESEFRILLRLMIEENMVNFHSLQGYTSDLHLREVTLNQLTGFAKEAEKSQEVLQKLKELGRENMKKLKESEVRLSKEICSLQEMAEELEKCGGSAIVLLQNARYFFARSEALLTQCLEPAQITDLSLIQITGLSKWVKVLQRSITLDPKTAHPWLVLSKDLRSIGLRYIQQAISGNPGRFDFSATVLGVESFTSGRHYWEVDVEKAAAWQLGICEDSVNRKDMAPKASRNTISLTRSVMGTQYTYWVSPPLKKVSLREQMHKVGVFLDYEWGQVSFYDMTEGALVYNFSSLPFQGALRPLFSLCIPNRGTISDSLSICLPPAPPYSVPVGPISS
ncbi:PREDICTED: probable E3 ubiquitin-protein ligase TRIML2 [Condylura cristata]|uniref:probable E3 ubiquitin-protein ligase TRIML2 n=1 Tax=Condylura cristata TaxID=143302 RepID=UPI0003344289|nr:PREDICTED: probable E3 ubiquitin-protein ligase TRIML2 [Condylura cristata]